MCNQLLQGLIQLERSNICHNDLKPENVLYNRDDSGNLKIKISDFGQAGRTGGTPGWTWPKFLTERKPGKSDLYSVGLLLLYVMCEDREVFYRIRNNYVKNSGQKWLVKFRKDQFFELLIDMINLKVTATKARKLWNRISNRVSIITMDYLKNHLEVDDRNLRVQDGIDMYKLNLASVSLLDRLA